MDDARSVFVYLIVHSGADHDAWAVFRRASVASTQEGSMHVPITLKSERQRQRALRTLLEIEVLHVAQCECPDRCDMLRRLREDIAELMIHVKGVSRMRH